MVTFSLVVVAALLIGGTLMFLGRVSKVLRTLIKELQTEREIVGIQKQIVGLTAESVANQRAMIDKRIELMVNSVTATKLLLERQSDPKWMSRFDEGRDNAKNN